MSAESVMPGLHHLFRAYEWLDLAISRRLIGITQAGPYIRILRHLSFEEWRGFFGESIASPAHARYVLRWCLKSVEVFRDAKLLSGQDHYAIAVEILADLEKLPPGDPAFSFTSAGGSDQAAATLRRLYLTHNLHLRLHVLVSEGRIDSALFARVRTNIFRTARDLFVATLGEAEYSSADPGQCMVRALDGALRKRLIDGDQYLKLKSLLETRMGQAGTSAPAGGGAETDHTVPADRDGILLDLAAANTLMNEVRRNPFLRPDDRKHFETCLIYEYRALIGKLGLAPSKPVIESLARRLDINLPGSAADSQSVRLEELGLEERKGAGAADTVDASWASEIVKEATARQ